MNRLNKKEDKKIKKNKRKNRIDNSSMDGVKVNRFSKLKILKYVLLIAFILVIIVAVRTAVSVFKWQSMAVDMMANEPSQVIDTDGKVIATLGDTRITKNLKLSELPQNIIDAYISIEDQRFYKHHGVDLPRTGAAVLSYLKNMGSSSFGGSSITQQLVKNLTGDNSSKVTRKIKEWFRAFAIENAMSKDEIICSYLNIIYVGPNVYGVGAGAEYYFGKDISNLSLAECAFLAGINNSPNSYNPFTEDKEKLVKNKEKIVTRTTAVIGKMKELGYITDEEYNTAKAEIDKGLKFKNGNLDDKKSDGVYSYHTDALIPEVIEDIAKEKGITEQFAENYIYMANLKIYSNQDSSVQSTMENEVAQKKYILNSRRENDVTSQTAMVVIENGTGKVVGCVGGSGKKKEARGFNRATQATRQTGSAGKPIAVLVPAIDLKLVTPITKIVDEATTFKDGSKEGYSPTDYNDYRGEITVRQAVESSQNIPFVKMMEMIKPKRSIEYMEKMGVTTLTKVDANLNLALGGLDKGISPLQMAVAYSTIANDGMYISPTFYSKVENQNGKVVVEPNIEKRRVYSKEVAYIVKSLLIEPVVGNYGTARYCKIDGIDTAAKTGTTNDEYDRWLCGFTPYYTAATWFGFDKNETIRFNRKNPSGQIWANVMKKIHVGKKNKKFEIPDELEKVKVCKDTKMIANSGCKNTYEEYFLKGTIPNSECTKHKGKSLVEHVEDNQGTSETTTDTSTQQTPSSDTSTSVPETSTSTQTEVTTQDTTQTENAESSSSTINDTTSTDTTSTPEERVTTIDLNKPDSSQSDNSSSDSSSSDSTQTSDSGTDSSDSSTSGEDDGVFEQ